MKRITVALSKGGVGKSSLSLGLAAELAKTHKTVLLDFDFQGNSSSTLIKKADFDIADVLYGKKAVADVVQATDIENLSVVPMIGTKPDFRMYKKEYAADEPEIIVELTKQLAGMGFEFCIMDTSSAFDTFEENIIRATDEIVTVMNLEPYALDGFFIFYNNLMQFGKTNGIHFKCDKIVLNKVDNRLAVSKNIAAEVHKNFSTFNIYTIPADQNFNKCINLRTPVQYMKNTKIETLSTLTQIAKGLAD